MMYNYYGDTPAMIACRHDASESLFVLLSYGKIVPTYKNTEGQNIIDIAHNNSRKCE